MPSSLTYITASGNPVNLNSATAWIPAITELRTDEWEYTLARRSLSDVTRTARERKARITCTMPENLDTMRRAFDTDMESGTPGTIVVDGEWRCRAFVTAMEATGDTPSPKLVQMDLTFTLLDGWWHRTATKSFSRTISLPGQGLNYPHDYPHDYAGSTIEAHIDNDSPLPSPAKIIIYGHAVSPTITLGDTRIGIDVTIPSGGHLIIDGTGSPKTATLVTANGDRRNVFAQTRRDQTAGENAFAPIPPGHTTISWDQSFGFDIEWQILEGTPPWNTL